MPESPWWLASQDRHSDALRALGSLSHRGHEGEQKLAQIVTTLGEVKRETEGLTYLECFCKSNLRRTIILIMPLSIQALSGISFAASYSTYLYAAGRLHHYGVIQITDRSAGDLTHRERHVLVSFRPRWRRNLTFWVLFVLTIILFVMAGIAVVGSVSALKGAIFMILLYC
jgi:SP family general alpha glucoside:H+ symporter-like MFS transporter